MRHGSKEQLLWHQIVGKNRTETQMVTLTRCLPWRQVVHGKLLLMHHIINKVFLVLTPFTLQAEHRVAPCN